MKVRTPLFYALSKSLKQGKEGGYINARTRGKTIIFQRKPHPISNSPAQAAWRAKYRRAVQKWNSLTEPEKQEYNERAAEMDPPITGFNLFIREYLLAPEEKLYEHYNVGDDNGAAVWMDNWFGQSFTVGTVSDNEDHIITKVKLKLYRIGSPGTVYVSIRNVDENGLPTGSDLSTGTLDGNTLTTEEPGEWYEIEMSEYTLQAGTKYAIIVRAPDTGWEANVIWRLDSTSPTYAGGCLLRSLDGGNSWDSWSDYDFMFEEYGKPA